MNGSGISTSQVLILKFKWEVSFIWRVTWNNIFWFVHKSVKNSSTTITPWYFWYLKSVIWTAQYEDEVSDTTSGKLETCPRTELFRMHFKDHSRCNLTCWCLNTCSLIRKIERKDVADNHFVISCGSRILEARRLRNIPSLWACGRFRQPAFFVIYFKDRSRLTLLLIYFSWLIDLLYRF